MTVIVPTFTKIRGPGGGIDGVVVKWAGLSTAGDTGRPIQRPDLADRSFQVFGTFNGATLVCEGSGDGTNWITLTNVVGGSLSYTQAGLFQITEATAFIRPNLQSAPGATSLTAIMTMRRSYR